jgi:hypothetical protein
MIGQGTTRLYRTTYVLAESRNKTPAFFGLTEHLT